MTRDRSWMIAGVALLAVVGNIAAFAARAETPAYPQVIICEVGGVQHFGYLASINADGSAIYMTPDRITATVSTDGVLSKEGGERTGNCAGQTLEALTANGQTRSFGGEAR